ncbi:hypothetical protein, partial [uncultured Cardiobacterium sp.]|uniref:hypothetical protein n=1 Tax=uncultured Cardiobacterium sp. TaxID=417619 RepID=UPI002635AEC4
RSIDIHYFGGRWIFVVYEGRFKQDRDKAARRRQYRQSGHGFPIKTATRFYGCPVRLANTASFPFETTIQGLDTFGMRGFELAVRLSAATIQGAFSIKLGAAF